ncbi:DUF4160 domain-containing protein [Nitrosomonas sp.]|uniref:DUF4160 domain-containing protein n=1 Tax=Nitrosomonas sp. TaxID=42353 RepID=UPI0025D37A5C|nr:DUF4160 domain-containing protein [Nitrosomonas sp.]
MIKLFFGDHPPPYFHAVYGEYAGLFTIDTFEMIEGHLTKQSEESGYRMNCNLQGRNEKDVGETEILQATSFGVRRYNIQK